MHALLFEVEPRPGHGDHYFEHAARLRPIVDAEPGMLFIDRYQSLARAGVILSHSLWQDEPIGRPYEAFPGLPHPHR